MMGEERKTLGTIQLILDFEKSIIHTNILLYRGRTTRSMQWYVILLKIWSYDKRLIYNYEESLSYYRKKKKNTILIYLKPHKIQHVPMPKIYE